MDRNSGSEPVTADCLHAFHGGRPGRLPLRAEANPAQPPHGLLPYRASRGISPALE